ncbi:hypothetical protein DRO22_00055 [Candidatus Bathyarchaeota archaeon]|nr:MAG: hypothetical protein DRO22_00055 [Candidatus Bathyarchaeota archaeon]
MLIFRRTFLSGSPPLRTWQCLPKALLRVFELERMSLASENSVSGLLKWKMGPITLPINANIEFSEIQEPETLVTEVRLARGPVRLIGTLLFSLRPIDEGKTEVNYQMELQKVPFPLSLLLWMVKKMVIKEYFDRMERLIQEWS